MSLTFWHMLLQDARYGMRILRKNPGFTTVCIFTLGLGISASTAIFSVVYGVLLQPLPYHNPQQLVRVWEANSKGGRSAVADPNFEDLRSQNHSLQGLAEFSVGLESVAGGSEPKRLKVATVSHDFFPVIGVQPIVGRRFAPEEEHPGAAATALVSYEYWKQFLNGAADLTSLKLKIDDHAASVIGVLPPGFQFPDGASVWMPRELSHPLPSRTAHNWQVIGRLREGVSLEQAHSDLAIIAQRLKQQYGQETSMVDAAIVPLQEALTTQIRTPLLVLLGAVGFLLLVACANVMNLLLAQSTARQGELAIRSALGASRGRLVRQFLAESLVLSLAGGVLGVCAAVWGVRALVALAPGNIPRIENVSVSLPVLLFALGLSVAVAVLLGIFTALRATSRDVQVALVESGKGQASTLRSPRAGRAIVAAQLAITLVLLVGAGLLGRSLVRLLSVDPGFRTEQVLTMDLNLPYPSAPAQKVRRVQFVDELFTRLHAIPGVEEVGGTNALPLNTEFLADGTFAVMTGQQIPPSVQAMMQKTASSNLSNDPAALKQMIDFFEGLFHQRERLGDADYVMASEGYLKSLGIPLLRGRLFDQHDTADAPHVALISESVVRQKFPKQDPIGQTIEFGNMDGDPRLLTVVGVVGDVRDNKLEAPPRPTIYVNYRQRPQGTSRLSVVMRSSADPAVIFPAARQIVRDLDPDVPPNFNTFAKVFSASLTQRRFNLTLVGVFAGSALLLAAAGIYGVMAYSVVRRTREIGVRIALGATAANVLRLVLGQGMMSVAFGIIAGVVGSFLVTRTLQSMLYEISAGDPVTFLLVAALLIVVALLACYIPARRATRIDPIIALRYD